MPTSFTSSYLVPAVLLNPLVILHAINTFASHYIPSAMRTVASSSLHGGFELLGPPGNKDPYLDIHKDNALCWRYTAVMVIIQVVAYTRICDNRQGRQMAQKARREQKLKLAELDKARRVERIEVVQVIPQVPKYSTLKSARPDGRAVVDRSGNITPETSVGSASPVLVAEDGLSDVTDLTDTSEEESIA